MFACCSLAMVVCDWNDASGSCFSMFVVDLVVVVDDDDDW